MPFYLVFSGSKSLDKIHMSLRNAYFSEWDISFAESGFFRLATPIRMEVETWLQNQNLDKPLIGNLHVVFSLFIQYLLLRNT